MFGQLVVTAGPDKGRTFSLTEGQNLALGRGEGTDTELRDMRVSRVHCHVQVDEGKLLLSDAGSSGGTFVNGQRVSQQVLQPGDVVKIGNSQLRFEREGAASEATQVDNFEAAPSLFLARMRRSAGTLDDLVGGTLGHYEIEKVLARGTTGMVFRAQEKENGKPVALKVLLPEISKDDEQMRRFVRAMKTMLPLDHPNIVKLYNAGKTGPHCWIAMELVEGESLTQVIERIGTAGMLNWLYGLRVAIQIGRALEFASEHQIIHRNVTPTNIMVGSSDKVAKLGDLMFAKALEGTLAEEITRPGQLVGELLYMSPERTRGSASADGRSDIYGLGATVYALLTGRPPLEGGSLPETISKIRNEEPAKPKDFQLAIPDLFEGTVLKMLAKRPEDRYQTPSELLAELEKVAKYQGLSI